MHKLHDLKDRLCEELTAFADRDLNTSNLDMIDKLAHATKNICKVIEMKDSEEYSGRMSYADDSSFARGRNAKRDSMGRYSRGYSYNDDVIHEMRSMMNSLPANKREDMERIIMKMEQM